jgi:hypothetical protein
MGCVGDQRAAKAAALQRFRLKFTHRRDIGGDYFEGSVDDMIRELHVLKFEFPFVDPIMPSLLHESPQDSSTVQGSRYLVVHTMLAEFFESHVLPRRDLDLNIDIHDVFEEFRSWMRTECPSHKVPRKKDVLLYITKRMDITRHQQHPGRGQRDPRDGQLPG